MFAKFLLVAAALVTATAVFAEPSRPEAFDELTAHAPQKPGQAPRLMNGVSQLSSREGRHQERLPLQLNGAIEKVKRAKYAPKRIQPTAAPKREAKAIKAKKAKAAKLAKAKAKRAKGAKLAKRHAGFKVEAMVAPARKGKSKTHPVGFEENLPMPSGAAPVARDAPAGF